MVSFQKSKTNFGQHSVSGENEDFKYIFDEDENTKFSVQSTTLDTIVKPYLHKVQRGNSLLWIDVEGLQHRSKEGNYPSGLCVSKV